MKIEDNKNSESLLFRIEAIEAIRPKMMGGVVISQPITFTVLTLFFVCAGIALLAFICVGKYTKKSTATGQIIPDAGILKVIAPTPGVITSKFVKEGSAVQKGDLLFIISGERSSALHDKSLQAASQKIQSRLESLNQERQTTKLLQRIELDTLDLKAQALAAALQTIKEQAEGIRSLIRVAADGVRRYNVLSQEQLISKDQLQEKQIFLLDQHTKLRSFLREIEEKELELKTVRSEIESATWKHANIDTQLRRSVLAAEQELIEVEQKREIHILAPGDGKLTGLISEVGATVDGSTPIASVVPENSKLQVELYVPSRNIGFIQLGDMVLIRVQAYPYQKYGQWAAKIKSISLSTFSIPELAKLMGSLPGADPNNTQEQYYRISLDIAHKQSNGTQSMPLISGMTVEADILRDRRTILEWIFEPLLGFEERSKL